MDLEKKTERDVYQKYPIILIVGPPRTGSTLLYQLMINSFDLCFFNNFMMKFPYSPVLMSKILSCLNYIKLRTEYQSFYGEVDGWLSPSQGYKVWNRWFPNDQSYVGENILKKKELNEISNTIKSISNNCKKPFINKWPGNSVRILPLKKALPDTLFIRITRDPLYVAGSIFEATKNFLDNEDEWFSTKPKEYPMIKNHPILQRICEQVFFLEKNITEDLEKDKNTKVYNVSYEKLCQNPNYILEEINAFINHNNKYKPITKRKNTIPESFEVNKKLSVPIETENIINNHFKNLIAEYGNVFNFKN
ncbi:MAG: sulfotransferase [Bacillota bacterium]